MAINVNESIMQFWLNSQIFTNWKISKKNNYCYEYVQFFCLLWCRFVNCSNSKRHKSDQTRFSNLDKVQFLAKLLQMCDAYLFTFLFLLCMVSNLQSVACCWEKSIYFIYLLFTNCVNWTHFCMLLHAQSISLKWSKRW